MRVLCNPRVCVSRHNSTGACRQPTSCVTNERITELTNSSATPLSMKCLVDTGRGTYMNRLSEEQKALHIAQFLHKEMPVRFAHRIIELDNLPHGLSDMPSIKTLRAWYEQGLQDMVSMPIPETLEQEREFHEVASAVYNRHDETLLQVAKGLLEFKKSGKAMEALKSQQHSGIRAAGKRSWPQGHGIGTELSDIADIHNDIDKFLMHRLGIRVVMGQYLALKENAKTVIRQEYDDRQFDDKVGLVQMSVLPADIATAAYEDMRIIFEREYPEYDAPALVIQGDVLAEIAYVPHQLYYMLFELIKNSAKATVRHHGHNEGRDENRDEDQDEELPPIVVTIGNGAENEDVVIKVSDRGGGISRSHSERIFSYLFTTAEPHNPITDSDALESFGRNSPLAGLGYGLPIARLYARYFGGDLAINSVEGFGTDAFVYLHKQGNRNEPLELKPEPALSLATPPSIPLHEHSQEQTPVHIMLPTEDPHVQQQLQ